MSQNFGLLFTSLTPHRHRSLKMWSQRHCSMQKCRARATGLRVVCFPLWRIKFVKMLLYSSNHTYRLSLNNVTYVAWCDNKLSNQKIKSNFLTPLLLWPCRTLRTTSREFYMTMLLNQKIYVSYHSLHSNKN